MDEYVIEVKEKIEKSLESLRFSLGKLRSGSANPAMLNGVKCDYYGEKMDIVNLCSISKPEARQLLVKPYSREDLKPIATAIINANLNVNPQIEADAIRIVIPALTEETRKDTAKKAKVAAEEAKVAIRNVRRDILSLVKEDDSMSDDYRDRVEEDIQKEVDKGIKQVDEIVNAKIDELMSI
ncbi:MAG: ribosome recycling factor [Bacilli bacterium]|nr:ribosome recycling factor [Bacilli bacterium]MDY6430396.1 ribosome recycling factor [Bacilli bacterium]